MKCPKCNFSVGDKVKMFSSITNAKTGKPIGLVYGQVENWSEGKCHIVMWSETGLATGLPNPNVMPDK